MDQSTASFTEPMRPSTSHSSVLTTRAMQRQSSGTGLGRSRETEEEENPSDDEVSETLDNNKKKCKIAPACRLQGFGVAMTKSCVYI